jgi:hypothetical protein
VSSTDTAFESGQAEQLIACSRDYTGHELAYEDIREVQLAALDERLQQRIDRIRMVKLRAEEAGIDRIRSLEDIVSLLLPHTAYKSYPENFLANKRWDRMTKWLSTVSTATLDDVNLEGIDDIDGWVARLEEHGHLISCSSGTNGNPALMLSTRYDAEFTAKDSNDGIEWGSSIKPDQSRRFLNLSMITATPRGRAMGGKLIQAFGDPAKEHFLFPVPRVTIGSVTKMITLRKAVAEGRASPSDIAEYEAESSARGKLISEAIEKSAMALIAARGEKLFINGMFGVMHPVAEAVRKRGHGGAEFHPENSVYLAGGTKRAQLPPDYKETILNTFNLNPPFIYQMYGMQEIQSAMPRCKQGGRYHIPPWLVCLPLDKQGEYLMPGIGEGIVEGRAAFFDLSMQGRWGGVISGDHIQVDYRPCACGARSPSIRDDIYRYADIQGDDKIACSGTIDAYVRGMS